MRPAAFEEQITRLMQEGYEPVTFSEAVAAPRRRTLAITFDDAFASVGDLARPILDRLGAPATVFAVTDFAASGRPLEWAGIDHWRATEHAEELRGMTWAQLRELAEGGWEIGSHTCDHPRLPALDDEELRRQLAASRAACAEALGRPCTSVAYPYGDVDARVVAAAGAAGYAAGAALPARWHGARALEWPRVGIYHGDDERRFALKTSATVRWMRARIEPHVRMRRS